MLGMTVRNGHKHHVHGTTNCSFRPPRTSRMQATSHLPVMDSHPSSAVGATVLKGLRDPQSEPPLAMHISTFTPSTSSPTTPCRWTCDRAWDRRKTQHHIETRTTFPLGASPMGQHNASGIRPAIGCWYTSLFSVHRCPQCVVRCVLTDDTKLAVQHRPRREDERGADDGIRHHEDELLRHKPAHVAHRQPEAEPRNRKSRA